MSKVREHGIIASAFEVRGLLEGRTTVLVRPVKPQPDHFHRDIIGKPQPYSHEDWNRLIPQSGDNEIHCPHGVPGDQLWVRETSFIWKNFDGLLVGEPHDYEGPIYQDDPEWDRIVQEVVRMKNLREKFGYGNWAKISSIHMPRWASRITLEITDVRIQPVQDLTQADAKAAGAEYDPCDHFRRSCEDIGCRGPYRAPFSEQWDASHPRRLSWESNPWVWLIRCQMIKE